MPVATLAFNLVERMIMNWGDIPESLRDELLAEKKAGVPVEELASTISMRPTTLDRRLREWANRHVQKQVNKIKLRGDINFRSWNEPPVFDGDFVVSGDYHMPYVDREFAEQMLNHAYQTLSSPRKLIIAGDLFNLDVFSRFTPSVSYIPTLHHEMDSTRRMLEDMIDVFDEIHALLGNHEMRFIYQVLGQLSAFDIEKLIDNERVTFHDYAMCIIDTFTGDWRATHQRNYSINSQTVGKKLAHKFRQHIITHHQHKVSKGFDDSGNNVIIDNGCMADVDKLHYVHAIDNTSPVMMQSYVFLKDGVGHLVANHEAFSDFGDF